MAEFDIRCEIVGPAPSGDWMCIVEIIDGARAVSRHEVGVRAADLARLAPAAASPNDLVRRSFAFLLEREPASSILGSFELTEIGRYFPAYEAEIRRGR